MPNEPYPIRLMTENTTSERLIQDMYGARGAFAVISGDAGSSIKIIGGRYGQATITDEDLYLKAHGGDLITRDRVSEPAGIAIIHPALALLWFLQRERLRELLGREEFWHSGLIARLNIAGPPSLVGSRIESVDSPVVPHEMLQGWSLAGRRLIEWRKSRVTAPRFHPCELNLDSEAMAARLEFANELEERQRDGGDLSGWKSFASKAAGEAARLAGLLHLAELAWESPLLNMTLIPAVPLDIWRVAEAHQRTQLEETIRLAQLGRDEDQVGENAIIAWVRKDPNRRRIFSVRDIQNAQILGKRARSMVIEFELERMESEGLVARGLYGEKALERYWINPWLLQ